MKITSVDLQKKNKDRVSVFVDEEYAFSLENIDAVRLGIKVGMEVTREDIHKFNTESNLGKARAKGADMISRKMHSKKEFKAKLIDKGYDEAIADVILAEFSELGYLDDFDYACLYVEDARLKLKGDKKIAYELSLKGIDDNTIKNALYECADISMEDIAQLINTRYKDLDLTDFKHKQKITAYLASRGFDFSFIKEAIGYAYESREDS